MENKFDWFLANGTTQDRTERVMEACRLLEILDLEKLPISVRIKVERTYRTIVKYKDATPQQLYFLRDTKDKYLERFANR